MVEDVAAAHQSGRWAVATGVDVADLPAGDLGEQVGQGHGRRRGVVVEGVAIAVEEQRDVAGTEHERVRTAVEPDGARTARHDVERAHHGPGEHDATGAGRLQHIGQDVGHRRSRPLPLHPDGLIAEHWGVLDMIGLLRQLGAVPPAPWQE